MGRRIFHMVGLGLLMAVAPAYAYQARPETPAECGAPAIRKAAAAHIAPQLVGCNIDSVRDPLLDFYKIVPLQTLGHNEASKGTILSQTPAAGEPLRAGAEMGLLVSTGPRMRPRDPARETVPEVKPVDESPASQEPRPEPEASAVASEAPASEAPVSAEPRPEPAAEPPAVIDAMPRDLPGFERLIRAHPWWAVLAGVLVLLTAGSLLRGKKPKRPSYGIAPRVSARLEFGPGRLSVKGPLVAGKRSGE